MAELGDPLRLPCGATLPNRLAKAAMTEGLAAADGQANPRHSRLYRRWAAGGAGLLITGNVMVD
jgi:2,4-dienoyl-CoA reductase-like NADH-dependent reductase (Old Yellow Enzyme family)